MGLKSKKDIWVIFLIILVITLSCFPLFKNIRNVNSQLDWQQMLSYYKADRQCVLEYHQIPFRTHYFGGGYFLLANPQDGFLSPFFIPVLIFGEIIGLKINVFFAHLIAALGMFYLTRRVLKYDYLGALFSVFIFCLGGCMHRLLIRGQDYIVGLYAFFLPLVICLFIKSKEYKKYLCYTAIVLVLIIMQAGLYAIPILLFMFLFSCLELFKYREKKIVFEICYLRNFFIIIGLTFLLGAIKILPMLELIKQNPRTMDGYNPFWGPLFLNIYKSFFLHQKKIPFAGSHWNYFYLGYTPVLFFLASLLIYPRKNIKYFILFTIFALLSFGAHTRLDLFKLLWPLPLFHSIESPTRYFVATLIFIIALVAGSIFSLSDKVKLKFLKPFFIFIIILTTVDLFFTNSTSEESFPYPVPKYERRLSFFQVKNLSPKGHVSTFIPKRMFLTRSWEWTMPTQYELMLQNIGKINWHGNIHLGEYAAPKYYLDWNGSDSLEPDNYSWHLNSKYKGEVYFLNHHLNKAEFQYFSPNKIIVKVNLVKPDLLVINQNYDKYWNSNFTKPLSYNGLLAVNLNQKGAYIVKFVYVPISFYLGLILSIITFVFFVFYLKNINNNFK